MLLLLKLLLLIMVVLIIFDGADVNAGNAGTSVVDALAVNVGSVCLLAAICSRASSVIFGGGDGGVVMLLLLVSVDDDGHVIDVVDNVDLGC